MEAAATAIEALYPVPYAARLVRLDTNTARRWVKGYAYTHKGERKHTSPVVQLVPTDAIPGANLTFEQLLTLRLVRAFRERCLGLPTIRKAAQLAVDRWHVTNPFVTKAFRSDGRSIFIELTSRSDVPGAERVMVDALSGQQQFRGVVEPSLFRDVVFVGERPNEWYPLGSDNLVVIRPDRAFGAPHIANSGVRTDVLAEAVTAEGGGDDAITSVASWFGVPERGVRDAVAAEAEWQTRLAA